MSIDNWNLNTWFATRIPPLEPGKPIDFKAYSTKLTNYEPLARMSDLRPGLCSIKYVPIRDAFKIKEQNGLSIEEIRSIYDKVVKSGGLLIQGGIKHQGVFINLLDNESWEYIRTKLNIIDDKGNRKTIILTLKIRDNYIFLKNNETINRQMSMKKFVKSESIVDTSQ